MNYITVRFLSQNTARGSETIRVERGTRLRAFLADYGRGLDNNKILVGGRQVSDDYELQEGDRISAGPKNVTGA